ncbi:MAG: 2-oxopent-4-enoate hydratase [Gammaproteobacteria bacterium]|nr:2-oxopent-4-enoate hydratase [Gammaproteobacteria bacterium]
MRFMHKIGLTAEAVQRQLGVDQPDCGVLFGDVQVADGGELSATATIQTKAEGDLVNRYGLQWQERTIIIL